MDGTLDIWDFIFKQNDPTLSLQVCMRRRSLYNVTDWVETKSILSSSSLLLQKFNFDLENLEVSEKITV